MIERQKVAGARHPRQARPVHGVYGFGLLGLDDPGPFAVPAGPEWPRLRVIHEARSAGAALRPGTVEVDEDRAVVWLLDGDSIEVDRAAMTVRLRAARRFPDQMVLHPYLGLPASIAARWLGRQSLHGAAVVVAGRAWGVVGTGEAGKSSTAAGVLARGHPVLSDDILVVDGGTLFAGPRCVDLREQSAALLGGEDLGVVGARRRWRVHPGEVPASAPLGGFVHLEWGDTVRVERLDARESLTGLIAHSVLRPDRASAPALLELGALTAFRFVRPKRLEAFDESLDQLLAVLG